MVEDIVFGQVGVAASAQYNRLVSSFAATTTDEAPISTLGVSVSLSIPASSRFVHVFQSIAGPTVSWLCITVTVVHRESQQDISEGLFDNMKIVCDASGQIFGHTNSWGQAVCMLTPESM